MKIVTKIKFLLAASALSVSAQTSFAQQGGSADLGQYLDTLRAGKGAWSPQWTTYLQNKATENELSLAFQYAVESRLDDLATGIIETDMKRFPGDKLVTGSLFDFLRSGNELSREEKLYKTWLAVHGPNTGNKGDEYKDFPKMWIAAQYADKGDIAQARSYIETILDPRTKRSGYELMVTKFVTSDLSVTEEQITFIAANLKTLDAGGTRYKNMAFLYGLSLAKKGRYQDAYAYLSADGIPERFRSDFKNYVRYYIRTMNNTGHYDLSVKVLEQMVSDGNSPENAMALLKESYLLNGGKAGDFDPYWKKLNIEVIKTAEDKLAEGRKEVKCPDFEFTDLDGNKIDNRSLLGKTVILDFWATWCGPCKGSLPAMQQAVTYFKNDPNVVFLFVNTFEDGKGRIGKIQKFLTDNKYSIKAVLDSPISGTTDFAAAKSFAVTGIPQKIFIDPKGYIRYISGGFDGKSDLLLEEVKKAVAMVSKS